MFIGRRNTTKKILTHENVFFSCLLDKDQASGALGETSDESDFSLLAWDSFSQEIRDLFTVVRSITYILLSKLFEFT